MGMGQEDTAETSRSDKRAVAPPRRVHSTRGLPTSRAVVGGLLVSIAALGTYVAATREEPDLRRPYAVAVEPIAAGEVIDAGAIDVRLLQLDADVAQRAVPDVALLPGTVALAPFAPGDLITRTLVVPAESDVAASVMAEVRFPVKPERTPRDLSAGEHVTVFATSSLSSKATTHVAAIDAIVVHYDTSRDSLGTTRGAVLTLALPPSVNLTSFVHDTQVSELEVIRSNGIDLDELRIRTAEPQAAVDDGVGTDTDTDTDTDVPLAAVAGTPS